MKFTEEQNKLMLEFRERLLQEIGEIYDGNVIWGEDLMRIPIADPAPTRLI